MLMFLKVSVIPLFLLLEIPIKIAAEESPGNIPNYSLNRQISFDPTHDHVQIEGETESMAFYRSSNDDKNDSDKRVDKDGVPFLNLSHRPLSPTSSSGILFQGASSLSGGAFVEMTECSFIPNTDDDLDMEDDDEDDEDPDDGHSSMLSNASLRKNRVVTNPVTSFEGESMSGGGDNNLSRKNTGKRIARPSLHSKTSTLLHSRSPDPLLLRTRGGALSNQDEFIRRLTVTALVTLLYEGVLGHILEFLKIAMQTAPTGTTYISILQLITKEKGLAGLWDGFIPWGVVQAIGKGGVFGLSHAIAKSYIMPLVEKGTIPKQLGLTLSGGIAGAFQGYVLSPTLLLKTRVMTNSVFRESMSLLRTTLLSFKIGFEVVNNEGLSTLMKGSNIFALKRFFDWSTRFFFSDLFELMLLNYSGVEALSQGQKITASLLGGTASTISTLPLDVIVSKSQDAKKAGVKVSAWDTFIKDYNEGGWKGLYDANMMGFEARLAHVCFTTVAIKTGTGIMYDYLYGKQ